MLSFENKKLDKRSVSLRKTIIQTMRSIRGGHLAPAFSVVEIVRVLYDHILNITPKNLKSLDRDRFILSKGHGALGLYTVLFDKNFITEKDLNEYCLPEGILGGHPEYGKVPGVEASTGSLGHGLSIGIGFAVAAKIDGRKNRTFVLVGDGECNEGSTWEAMMSAAKHKLDNLVVLVDYNKHQSYGPTSEVLELEPFAKKWEAFGAAAREIDGHDVEALEKNLKQIPFTPGKPSVLVCHTVKGKGISYMENNLTWHHKKKMTDDDFLKMNQDLESENT